MSASNLRNTKPAPEDLRVLQYKALREEILQLRASVTRILTGGISGLPALAGIAEHLDLHVVVYAAPFMVVVFMLLFVSEQNSLMRIGVYIRKELEPRLNTPRVIEHPWERYLEEDRPRRHPEDCSSKAAYIIYTIYYWGAATWACTKLYTTLGETSTTTIHITAAAAMVYFAVFVLAGAYTWLSTRHSSVNNAPLPARANPSSWACDPLPPRLPRFEEGTSSRPSPVRPAHRSRIARSCRNPRAPSAFSSCRLSPSAWRKRSDICS